MTEATASMWIPRAATSGRDERLARAARERLERPRALVLRSATVHGNRTEAKLGQLLRQPVCAVPRPGEHDGPPTG